MPTSELSNFIRELFLKGHYDQCLEKLCDAVNYSDDYFICENNKLVCDSLMNLVSVNCHIKGIEAFLQLYDNCNALSKHTTKQGPLYVRLTILFNCQWLALSTMHFSNENQVLWDRLLSRVVNSCHQVFSETPLISQNIETWDIVLKIFLETLARLSTTDIEIASIFLESVVAMILIHLQSSPSTDIFEILNFLKSVSKDAVEYLARNDVVQNTTENMVLFKFGLDATPSTYDDKKRMPRILNIFAQLGCVLAARLKETPSRYFTTASVKSSSLWHYSEALKSFNEQDRQHSLSHLLIGLPLCSSDSLHCRLYVLLGRVYSEMGERQKALNNFAMAVKLDSNFCPALYFQAREFGKMGIIDSMLKCYQNLLLTTKHQNIREPIFPLEYHLLRILQEPVELSKPIATYLLAVSYGINEMFQDSQITFEKLLTRPNLSAIIDGHLETSFIKLPHAIIILHEGATMNLMTGNLSRAEEICRQAISCYPSRKLAGPQDTDVHGVKDQNWVKETLQEEFQIKVDEPIDSETYYEDYLSIFDEDVVGILILAELQEKNGTEDVRLLLNQAILLLSKYMARSQKDANYTKQRNQETLVKALTCKTCLAMAKMQTSLKPFTEVDKMFKRALSCNNGDKDVLYFYTNFLMESNKPADANKLWNTFCHKDSIFTVEKCQSLALRHLLRPRVSQRLMAGLSIKMSK